LRGAFMDQVLLGMDDAPEAGGGEGVG
jgi:hypothetical protein